MSLVIRPSWLLMMATAVALASTLTFLYAKTEEYDPSASFESLALLRQLKQLDAQWELNVLKSKIGITQNYDPLVEPLTALKAQWDRLETLVNLRALSDPSDWLRGREAYLQALGEKTELVERFKSHNAVLRNSLAFLPIAENDIHSPLSQIDGSDQPEQMAVAADLYNTVLSTMEYAQTTSTDKAAEIEAGLQRLTEGKALLPPDLQAALEILMAHVRTILREQPLVNGLVDRIGAVPMAARLDELHRLIDQTQLQAAERDLLYHEYVLLFSAIIAGLLLYVGARLIRSYAVINRVNKKLQEANDGLEQRVQQRTRELRETQSELVATARQAGMAEIATNVLHNVGNVLNSVNISADLVSRRVRGSKSQGLAKAVQLINQHAADLGDFISRDEKGKLLPGYLNQLVEALAAEQQGIAEELEHLTKSVDHIKEIVATQQSYAGASSMLEAVRVSDLLEDALRMNAGALQRHRVTVIKEFSEVPPLLLDKHRLLLILVNLISNAKQALSTQDDRAHVLTLSVRLLEGGNLQIRVQDDGEGIAAENLTRIFAHGFTTRKDGHGFGLHSCALAAMEMEASLTAHSDGPGQGAAFVLELPAQAVPGRA
ncbi:Sensor histidine kinase TodS [compost metagenome]